MATKRKSKVTKDPDRVALATAVAKICAYRKCGDVLNAQMWARTLQEKLRSLGLIQ